MSVSLQKGQKVNLSKDNAGLAKVIVGLGWDEAKPSGGGGGGFFATLFGGGAATTHQAIDCDASAIFFTIKEAAKASPVLSAIFNNRTRARVYKVASPKASVASSLSEIYLI